MAPLSFFFFPISIDADLKRLSRREPSSPPHSQNAALQTKKPPLPFFFSSFELYRRRKLRAFASCLLFSPSHRHSDFGPPFSFFREKENQAVESRLWISGSTLFRFRHCPRRVSKMAGVQSSFFFFSFPFAVPRPNRNHRTFMKPLGTQFILSFFFDYHKETPQRGRKADLSFLPRRSFRGRAEF